MSGDFVLLVKTRLSDKGRLLRIAFGEEVWLKQEGAGCPKDKKE